MNLTLADVGNILAAASPFMPAGRIWVTFDGENGIVLQTTNPDTATEAAEALGLGVQHPTREYVKQWARDVDVNGKEARLQVELIEMKPRLGFTVWNTETTEESAA